MAKVFISYRQLDDTQRKRVRIFAERLRGRGIDVVLDQFYQESNPGGPPEGWPQWSSDQAVHIPQVLIIGNEAWFRCFDGTEEPGTGFGAACEAGSLRQRLYDAAGKNEIVRVVYFADADIDHISHELKRYHRFHAEHDFDSIVKWLGRTPPDSASAQALRTTTTTPNNPLGLDTLVLESQNSIFISYRRDDTAGHVGRLYDNLTAHFNPEQVFMDVDRIEPGEDFVKAIDDAVGACDVLLAVIGRNWLSIADGAERRLDNPNDFVRLEITAALKRNIRVIPVLVHGARMPSELELPADLAALARRQAHELGDGYRWKQDLARLVMVMERQFSLQPPADEESQLLIENQQHLQAEQEAEMVSEDRRQLAARRFVPPWGEESRSKTEEGKRGEEEKRQPPQGIARILDPDRAFADGKKLQTKGGSFINVALWFTQVLLALLFLISGGVKLAFSAEQWKATGSPMLSMPLVRFIGVCQVLGALGLVLPGILSKWSSLVPLSGAGMLIIMVCFALANVDDGFRSVWLPVTLGILAAFVSFGRWRLAPHPKRR